MPPRRPAARSPGASYSALWIKRARRSKAEIDDIKSVLRNDQPMMVRAGLCQLVARATTEKTEAQYHQTVIRLLTEMRLEGEIRFSWIIDESRRTRETQTFDSVADAVRDTAKFYRRSALRECSDYVENLVGERSNSVTPFAGLSAG